MYMWSKCHMIGEFQQVAPALDCTQDAGKDCSCNLESGVTVCLQLVGIQDSRC